MLRTLIMESKTPGTSLPVPEQKEGGKTDAEYSKEAVGTTAAHDLFLQSRERLLNINEWDKIAGALSAVFKLTDSNGREITGKAKVGDFIKIDIPGPGTKAGKGFDWVRIEVIEENHNDSSQMESLLVRVRPCDNPTNNKEDVAHFFTNKASSSFTLQRDGITVTAGVHGRNEVPNTKTESLYDKTRNSTIAVAAIVGLNAPQWKSLVKGIMGD
jgi:hypothetical protein